MNGKFYGTTNSGGHSGSLCPSGCGTVFSVTPTGAEHVLYRFRGSPDGSSSSSLINVKGLLYGTSFGGGKYGAGTVFSISTSGTERVLHNFRGRSDGSDPEAGLIDVNGTLYGTTPVGARHNNGTVFSVTTTGTEHILYSFRGKPDGSSSEASLIELEGTLYGTTTEGGTRYKGTIFSISTTGKEQVLHSFSGSPDGQDPSASLIVVKGALYGTTQFGGPYGSGYSRNRSSALLRLEKLTGAALASAAAPMVYANAASLIDMKGHALRHDTVRRRVSSCTGGCGTVFCVNAVSSAVRAARGPEVKAWASKPNYYQIHFVIGIVD